jgi:hypothetical protein
MDHFGGLDVAFERNILLPFAVTAYFSRRTPMT